MRADGKLSPHSTIGRLNDWMAECGVRYYSFVNTHHERGDARPDELERALAENFMWECVLLSIPCVVVALGAQASRALGALPHVRWPHTSGRNRQLNDPSAKRRAVAALKGRLACA